MEDQEDRGNAGIFVAGERTAVVGLIVRPINSQVCEQVKTLKHTVNEGIEQRKPYLMPK